MRVKCGHCNDVHDLLGMEPSYMKPDAALGIPVAHVKANKDFCVVGTASNARYFVRVLIPFEVLAPPPTPPLQRHWGIWAEVMHEIFEKVLDLWNDSTPEKYPPMEAKLANSVKGYTRTCWPPADPETLGLKGTIRFRDAKQIPYFAFDEATTGPFAAETRAGMTRERFAEVMIRFLHGE